MVLPSFSAPLSVKDPRVKRRRGLYFSIRPSVGGSRSRARVGCQTKSSDGSRAISGRWTPSLISVLGLRLWVCPLARQLHDDRWGVLPSNTDAAARSFEAVQNSGRRTSLGGSKGLLGAGRSLILALAHRVFWAPPRSARTFPRAVFIVTAPAALGIRSGRRNRECLACSPHTGLHRWLLLTPRSSWPSLSSATSSPSKRLLLWG